MYNNVQDPFTPRIEPDRRFAHLAEPVDDTTKRDLGYYDARERMPPQSDDPAYRAGYDARMQQHPEDDPHRKTGWWDARFRKRKLAPHQIRF
ncbi:MAG TPA: hypothetical protein VFL98_02880 [Candidatus Paceibacterota bacterium]|nr:hypothetical protein [Candidatus Paceibacterota bacterium]